jgi:thiol-disulfide isomerase/thioredoxin
LKKTANTATGKKRLSLPATAAVFVVAMLVGFAGWKLLHGDSTPASQTAPVTSPGSATTGGAFPEFSLQAVSDKPDGPAELNLNAIKGHKTVFVIFKPSCPHCRKEADLLHALQPEFAGKFKIVLASTGIKEESLDFGNATGMTGLIYLGTYPLAAKLGIQTVPAVFFVNEQGLITYVQIGEKDEVAEREILTAFAEGREIPQSIGLGQ